MITYILDYFLQNNYFKDALAYFVISMIIILFIWGGLRAKIPQRKWKDSFNTFLFNLWILVFFLGIILLIIINYAKDNPSYLQSNSCYQATFNVDNNDEINKIQSEIKSREESLIKLKQSMEKLIKSKSLLTEKSFENQHSKYLLKIQLFQKKIDDLILKINEINPINKKEVFLTIKILNSDEKGNIYLKEYGNKETEILENITFDELSDLEAINKIPCQKIIDTPFKMDIIKKTSKRKIK